MTWFLQRLLASVIGLVFIASGILKLMDPVGTSLIVDSYLSFLHMGFLSAAAYAGGEMLALGETVMGIGLVTGVWRRFFAICTFVMLGFFTLVTLLLAIFNPPMDCGCFGEAVHLTHAQSLAKNIVLLLLCCAAFLPLYNIGCHPQHRIVAFSLSLVLVSVFAVYSMRHLPLVDFTKYAPSSTIVAEETDENPDLLLWDADYVDCSEAILDGRIAAVVVYRPEKLSDKDRNSLMQTIQVIWNSGFTPVILASSPTSLAGANEYYSDYKTLITLNRSNGGVVLLDDGYIIKKFGTNDTISAESLSELCCMDSTEAYIDAATRDSLLLQFFILGMAVLTLFV